MPKPWPIKLDSPGERPQDLFFFFSLSLPGDSSGIGLIGLEYLSILFQLLNSKQNISSYKLYIENDAIAINRIEDEKNSGLTLNLFGDDNSLTLYRK